MPLQRSACGRFPDGYSRAVVDTHFGGTKKGNVVRALPEAAAAPATVSRRASLNQPLEPADAPGRRRKAATREPGDLSTMPTVTTPSGGRRMGDTMTLRLLAARRSSRLYLCSQRRRSPIT